MTHLVFFWFVSPLCLWLTRWRCKEQFVYISAEKLQTYLRSFYTDVFSFCCLLCLNGKTTRRAARKRWNVQCVHMKRGRFDSYKAFFLTQNTPNVEKIEDQNSLWLKITVLIIYKTIKLWFEYFTFFKLHIYSFLKQLNTNLFLHSSRTSDFIKTLKFSWKLKL